MIELEYLPSSEGFLGINIDDAFDAQSAKAVIVPFGIEATVSYQGGTAKGPEAILASSHQVELFDESLWCEPHRAYGIATVKPFPIKPDLHEAMNQIDSITQTILNENKFPLVLGGEHSLTPGVIRAFARTYSEFSILHFDAHADLRDSYQGESYSHACAIRRCLDNASLRQVVSCGIRNISSDEIPFLENNRDRIQIYWAKDKSKWNISEIVKNLVGKSVYITVDVDGFDPSIMPATGTPEPGGLLWDEVIQIIHETSQVATIIGADINELAPIAGFHASDFLAAKLAYKILSYALM